MRRKLVPGRNVSISPYLDEQVCLCACASPVVHGVPTPSTVVTDDVSIRSPRSASSASRSGSFTNHWSWFGSVISWFGRLWHDCSLIIQEQKQIYYLAGKSFISSVITCILFDVLFFKQMKILKLFVNVYLINKWR